MWRFKGCPKCQGDILLDHEHNRWHELCLQCGFRRGLQNLVEVQAPAKIEKGTVKNA